MRTTTIERGGKRRQILALLLALLLALTMLPLAALTQAQTAYGVDDGASEPIAITGTSTINAGGTYSLDPALNNATITIATSDPVKIIGNGVGDGSMEDANANIGLVGTMDGIDLTLQEVKLSNNASSQSVIDFVGGENTLSFIGTNLIEGLGGGGSTKAMVRVAPDAKLAVAGSGTLYFYAQGQGAGFGADSGAMNGDLSFAELTLFGKTTYPGPAIGSGASYSGPAPSITFYSGEYTLVGNSMAAIIGGGAGSGGGAHAAPGGNVKIEGGTFNLNVDYSGAAIGGGGYSGGNDAEGGTAVFAGGTVRTYLDTNAVGQWSGYGVTEAGVNPVVITATKVNEDSEPVFPLVFDTSQLAEAADSFEVSIDGQDFYTGGGHHYRFVNEDVDRDLEERPIGNTLTNWTEFDEPNLYFFVSGADHGLVVNGESFTATFDDETESFTLAAVSAPEPDTRPWNQTIDVSWYNTEDTEFTLESEEQFAGFAAIVNGEAGEAIAPDTFAGKTVKLATDIYLNDHAVTGPDDTARPWIPIAYTGQLTGGIHGGAGIGDFAGTFDGQGHVIHNLYFNDTAAATVGLFGVVIPGAVIKNFGVTGYMNAYRQNGAVVGYTGGNRTTPGEAAWPVIENVFNAATVIGSGSGSRGTGGIVGTAGDGNEGGATIRNCYNLGAVTNTYRPAGGIAGIAGRNVVIENCYSVGTVVSNGGNSYQGAITATSSNATITNTYYLDSSCTSGVAYGGSEGMSVAMTAEELKSVEAVKALGEAFNCDLADDAALNNGYPVLAWQGGTVPEAPAPTVDTSWYNVEDTEFTLTTKAQFLGFAAIVNNKAESSEAGAVAGIDPAIPADDFQGKTVTLATDIDLGGIEVTVGGFDETGAWTEPVWEGDAWEPIASNTSSGMHSTTGGGSGDGLYGRPFKGTFDGGFHEITNLYVPYTGEGDNSVEGNSHGLFGDLGQAGVVKNIIVKSGFVKGARFTAGVVGRNWGEVENCANFATVQANGRGGGAGIVGVSYDNGHDPVVKNSVNYGQIYNPKRSTSGSPYPGGIAACNEGKIENCLNIGKVGSGGVAFGGVVGEGAGNPTVINSYFLDTSAAKLVGTGRTSGIDELSGAKIAEEIKTPEFAAQLGEAFVSVAGEWPQLADGSIVPPAVGAPGSGDLNGDGAVTVNEALAAAQAVVSGIAGTGLTSAQVAALDMDGDGRLTMADVVRVLRAAVGL